MSGAFRTCGSSDLGPDARAARTGPHDQDPGFLRRELGDAGSLATALWLQTMAPLEQGDTVELQGIAGRPTATSPPITPRSWGGAKVG